MKINKLMLDNFGIYAGKQEMDFSSTTSKKPIILLGGFNGRGKTTILEAILLCFYGSRSYAVAESKLTYQNYLNKYINRADKTLRSSIVLNITVEIDSNETELRIVREWEEKNKYTNENFVVYRNDQKDDILTDHWNNQVEYIIPSGLARFFLFDGEKVAELVDNFSDSKLKAAIKALLGIDVIEQLDEDLRVIVNKNKVAQEITKKDEEVASIKEKRETLRKEEDRISMRIAELNERIEQDAKLLNEKENQFASRGGKLLSKQEEFSKRRNNLEVELKEVITDINEYLIGFTPLLLIPNLLNGVNKTTNSEKKCEVIAYEIVGVEKFIKENNLTGDNVATAIWRLKKEQLRMKQLLTGKEIGLSFIGADQLARILKVAPKKLFEEIQLLIAKKNEIQTAIDKANDYVHVEVDTKSLEKLLTEIKTLSSNIAKNQSEIEHLEIENTKINNEIHMTDRNLTKLTEMLVSQYENQDNSVRILRYSSMVQNVLSDFKSKVQELKVNDLSEVVTQKFLRIIGKRTLICNIQFNKKDLTMHLYNEYKQEVNRKQLSAGEQQILATAIVWGFIECTGLKFPMIIDTPLARLDSIHREMFVENYLPNAGEQIIVLSTDAEITNGLKEKIESKISKNYLLEYDDEKKSTKIIEGYFRG